MRKLDLNYPVSVERSERFFQNQGHWYFKTREGIDFGPFVSKNDATLALKDFLRYRIKTDEIRARWGIV